MKQRFGGVLLASALSLAPLARAAVVAPGVDLIPGRFVPGTQPDGNTVVFRGKTGLIVIDAGRHPDHAQAVIDFAKAARLPIVAIVNSHWHLDHVGGNLMLRKAYPAARVYASDAITAALTGFLAHYREQLTEEMAKTSDAETQNAWRAELALIDAGAALGPDEVVASSGLRTLAGRPLEVTLETRAVTAGDVSIYDPETKVLAAGDLVTLPVPFFDTACPDGWKSALDRLAQKDFEVIVPGHGAPLTRAAFEVYRGAFGHLLACVASKASNAGCIDGWMTDAATLVADADPKFVRGVMGYYVGDLRDGAPRFAKLCGK